MWDKKIINNTLLEKALIDYYKWRIFMENGFDYAAIFNKVLKKVSALRLPSSQNMDYIEVDKFRQNAFFPYKSNQFSFTYSSVKSITYTCLARIISGLLIQNRIEHEVLFELNVSIPEEFSRIVFSVKDFKKKTIYLFKEIEPDFLLINGKLDISSEEKDKLGVSDCKMVYFTFDEAFKQNIFHNEDIHDASRGTNMYSFKWFFELYFGKHEYLKFEQEFKKYISNVTDCIGYVSLKTLSYSAQINIKRIVEKEFKSFNYASVLGIPLKDKEQKAYNYLYNHFLESKTISFVYGDNDCAESIITAEWLFRSFKKVKAVDLSIIAVGYFKFVEQLLFSFMSLQTNKGLVFTRNSKENPIELTDENIKSGITIGTMAHFIKNNRDLFSSNYDDIKDYFVNQILDYSKLRNGYTHKHNIHDWDIIETIRQKSYAVAFSLLAAYEYTDIEKEKMGIIKIYNPSEFDKLCEYWNYHPEELFIFQSAKRPDIVRWFISKKDENAEIKDNAYLKYNCLLYANYDDRGRICQISEEEFNKYPVNIYLGRIEFGFDINKGIVINPPKKVLTIFENGRYVGPSIIEEEKSLI